VVCKKLHSRKVRKNDIVVVISGDEKGKNGKVVKVLSKRQAVVVEGLNKVKKHVRGTAEQPGRIEEKEAPIHYSNVAIWSEAEKKAVRVGWRQLENGKKVRVSRKTGDLVDKS